jgi:hypothetical protein
MRKTLLLLVMSSALLCMMLFSFSLKAQQQVNGTFQIEIMQNDNWQQAGELEFGMFYSKQTLHLPKLLTASLDNGADFAEIQTKIRLSFPVHREAHIDYVMIDGSAPVNISGAQEGVELAMKKVAGEDYDVIDVENLSIVMDFDVLPGQLEVKARIEPDEITAYPFMYPEVNTYKEISNKSKFYTYEINSVQGTLNMDGELDDQGKPFFKIYNKPGTGHPDAFTYGWVMNDDEHLYVTIDFVPDNTIDGDKDYTKVFVKTNDGVKAYKLSVPEQQWGIPGFTYTKNAVYQHKLYEFRIPLSEFDNTNKLEIAFAAYGTAAPPPPISWNMDLVDSYGNGGIVTVTDTSGTGFFVNKSMIADDGSVFYFGYGVGGGLIAKVDPDGMLDTAYADSGFYYTGITTDELESGILLNDGSLIAVGADDNGVSDANGILVKLDNTGTPVIGFGSGGRLEVNYGGEDHLYVITPSHDETMFYVGGDLDNDLLVSKFNMNGGLVTEFGTNGFYTNTSYHKALGIAEDTASRLAVVANVEVQAHRALIIINEDASVVNDYSDLPNFYNEVFNIEFTSSGKYKVYYGGSSQCFIKQYNFDGSDDPSFGTSGLITFDKPYPADSYWTPPAGMVELENSKYASIYQIGGGGASMTALMIHNADGSTNFDFIPSGQAELDVIPTSDDYLSGFGITADNKLIGAGHQAYQGDLFAFKAELTHLSADANQNNVLHFDGIDDLVAIPHANEHYEQNFTVEGWVKIESGNSNATQIVGKYLGNDCQYSIQIGNSADKTLRVWGYDDSEPGYVVNMYTDVNAFEFDEWTHIALTHDFITQQYHLYVNGEIAVSAIGDLPMSFNTHDVMFGNGPASSSYFKGAMDEFRMWDTVLGQTAIQYMMNNEVVVSHPNLYAYYNFNQGIAGEDNNGIGMLVDTTANQIDGVLSGFALTGTSSNFISGSPVSSDQVDLQPKGIHFDGVDDYIEVPHYDALNLDNYTIELWMYVENGTDNLSTLIGKNNNNESSYSLQISNVSEGTLRFWVFDGTGYLANMYSSAGAFVVDEWTHVAITYDNTIQLYTMYVNGDVVASYTGTSGTHASNLPIQIGRGIGSSDYLFKGKMDEIRIWDRPLSACELNSVAYNEFNGPEFGLVAYYPIRDGVAGGNNSQLFILKDYSANDYHGTMYNFALTGATSNRVDGNTDIDFTETDFATPPFVNAGDDDSNNCGLTYVLNGNDPGTATSIWSIVSGGTGSFNDANDPNAVFSADADGVYTLMWTIDDGTCEASDNVDITINNADVTAPVPDVSELPDLSGECSVEVTDTPTATDDCAGVITATTSDPLMYDSEGTYTITWTYDDGNGNTVTQDQTVIVDDITAPVPDVATLPALTGECSVEVTDTPTATDNCVGIVTATTSDPLSYTEQGTYTITWTYDDGNGNTVTQDQSITVEDITDPSITCVADQTIDLAEGETSYTVSGTEYDPTTDDNCAVASVSNDLNDAATLDGEVLAIGTHTITWTVTDAGGNSVDCSTSITVNEYIGLADLAKYGIGLYPNPSNGNFTIENADGYTVSIFNVAGELISNYEVVDNKLSITMDEAQKGMYIIRFVHEEKQFSSRFIIE